MRYERIHSVLYLYLVSVVVSMSLSFSCYAQSVMNFRQRVARELAARKWSVDGNYRKKLNRSVLLQSLELGRRFIISNQCASGNFNYEYDWKSKRFNQADNQVRQAGALWGVSLIHQFRPKSDTRMALDRGFGFFQKYTRPGPEDSLFIAYPGQNQCSTGTVALVALAYIEFLRSEVGLSGELRTEYITRLDGYLKFLKSRMMADGHFSSAYDFQKGRSLMVSSPYFDGEALLCLCKAARYLGKSELLPLIEKAAFSLARSYTFAWKTPGGTAKTKGFYQWGTMSFYEYSQSGWKDAELYGDIALLLAHWMIYKHRTLDRTRNTAYAHEGLIHAWLIAETMKNDLAAENIRMVVDKALYKLMTWQVGGPLADFPSTDETALGGFQNHSSQSKLRIDVTQHQCHAMILALRYLYPKETWGQK